MSINAQINSLSERIARHLENNKKASLTELKQQFGCRASEILLALGALIPTGNVELSEDGWETIASYNQKNAKEEG